MGGRLGGSQGKDVGLEGEGLGPAQVSLGMQIQILDLWGREEDEASEALTVSTKFKEKPKKPQ